MAISDTVASLLGFAQRQVDCLVSPESQQRAYSRVSDFAAARPLLFTFILTQLSLAAIPTLFFLAFAVSTTFFILGLGLLLALFCLGLGFAVLVPALCLACGVATCLWAWGVVAYLAARRAAGMLTRTSAADEDDQGEARPQPPPLPPAALTPQPSSSTPSSGKLEEQGHAMDMDMDKEADDGRNAGSEGTVEKGNIQGT